MKKTVLHPMHAALKAKMAPFGGYEMPIQYSGIIREHEAARHSAVIFDTCHMGEFSISGETAESDLERILSCRVSSLRIGHCRYGFLCNEQGGVIDDQILYRLGATEFFMVVNAGTQDTDFAWIGQHLSQTTEFQNISDQTAKLDLQGPASPKVMRNLMPVPIENMRYYTWAWNRYRDKDVLVSRTGYTGEAGFEIYCSGELALEFWNDCLKLGVTPAGLGARDTLRLEMGFPLYGHELDDKTNAVESGFTRAIATDKEFIGSPVVLDSSRARNKLVGILLDGRRAARAGDKILDSSGVEIGRVTSGSFSPSLGRAIAMGYVGLPFSAAGTQVLIGSGGNELPGIVTDLPFYKQGTARMAITPE